MKWAPQECSKANSNKKVIGICNFIFHFYENEIDLLFEARNKKQVQFAIQFDKIDCTTTNFCGASLNISR